MSGVTIAVGGRWREIEDENAQLRRDLVDSRAQLEQQEAELKASFSELEASRAEAFGLRRQEEESMVEAQRLCEALESSKKAREEVEAQNLEAARREEELLATKEALCLEVKKLGQGLEEANDGAFQLRAQLATKEQLLALETSLKKKAEAKNEMFHVELSTLESRYGKQSTHVQLLLREKERLWSQLSRSREAKPPVSEPSKPRCEAPVPRAKSFVRRKQEPTVGAVGLVAELERKLWHTKRALDRERAAHERTKGDCMGEVEAQA